ncbi:hypothetical protein EBR57_03705 [bacterium]|nr:hypothetical protein [bacterium]
MRFSKKAVRILIVFCLTFTVSPVLGAEDQHSFVAGLRLRESGLSIDIINLPKCTVSKSLPVDRNATHLVLKDKDTVFLPFRGNFERGYHQILELSLNSKKTQLWATPLSAGPGKIMTEKNAYWVCFDHIIKPKNQLEKSRENGLSNYQESGFELYSKEIPAKLINVLRLGEFHHIFEWCWDKKKTKIYLASSPFATRDTKTESRQFFKHCPSYLQVIDIQKQKITLDQDISEYIEDISGFYLQDEKFYICGIRDPKKKDLDMPKSANRYLQIFDEKTFNHCRSIKIDFLPTKIVGAPMEHRLFILHRSLMKNNKTSITVINTLTDQLVSKLEFSGIQKIACTKGFLFVMVPENLIIIDATTLKTVKKLPGTYTFISEES